MDLGWSIHDASHLFTSLLALKSPPTTAASLLSVWMHECFRVFADRLREQHVTKLFVPQLQNLLENSNLTFSSTVEELVSILRNHAFSYFVPLAKLQSHQESKANAECQVNAHVRSILPMPMLVSVSKRRAAAQKRWRLVRRAIRLPLRISSNNIAPSQTPFQVQTENYTLVENFADVNDILNAGITAYNARFKTHLNPHYIRLIVCKDTALHALRLQRILGHAHSNAHNHADAHAHIALIGQPGQHKQRLTQLMSFLARRESVSLEIGEENSIAIFREALMRSAVTDTALTLMVLGYELCQDPYFVLNEDSKSVMNIARSILKRQRILSLFLPDELERAYTKMSRNLAESNDVAGSMQNGSDLERLFWGRVRCADDLTTIRFGSLP